MIEPSDPNSGLSFSDMWPFDDTLNVRFWSMRHIPNTEQFYDDISEYHLVFDDDRGPYPIPSVKNWVNIVIKK